MNGGVIDTSELRHMSSKDLVDKLAETENLDDVIEAEMQRRSLARLSVLRSSSLAMMGLAVISLIMSALYVAGIFSGLQSSSRGSSRRMLTWWRS